MKLLFLIAAVSCLAAAQKDDSPPDMLTIYNLIPNLAEIEAALGKRPFSDDDTDEQPMGPGGEEDNQFGGSERSQSDGPSGSRGDSNDPSRGNSNGPSGGFKLGVNNNNQQQGPLGPWGPRPGREGPGGRRPFGPGGRGRRPGPSGPPGPPRPPGPPGPGQRDDCGQWSDWQQAKCFWPNRTLDELPSNCRQVPVKEQWPEYLKKFVEAKVVEGYNMIVDEFKRRGAPPMCGHCARSFECRVRNETKSSRRFCPLKEVRPIDEDCGDGDACVISEEKGGCPPPLFLKKADRLQQLREMIQKKQYKKFATQLMEMKMMDEADGKPEGIRFKRNAGFESFSGDNEFGYAGDVMDNLMYYQDERQNGRGDSDLSSDIFYDFGHDKKGGRQGSRGNGGRGARGSSDKFDREGSRGGQGQNGRGGSRGPSDDFEEHDYSSFSSPARDAPYPFGPLPSRNSRMSFRSSDDFRPERRGPGGRGSFGPYDDFGPERRGPGGRGSFGPYADFGPERRGPGGRGSFGPSYDFGPERRGPGGRGPFGPERRGPGERGPFGPSADFVPEHREQGRRGSFGPERRGPGGRGSFGPYDDFGPERRGPGGRGSFGPYNDFGPERRGPGGRGSFGPYADFGPERRGPGGRGPFGPSYDFGPERRGPGGRGPFGPERRGPGERRPFGPSADFVPEHREQGRRGSFGPSDDFGPERRGPGGRGFFGPSDNFGPERRGPGGRGPFGPSDDFGPERRGPGGRRFFGPSNDSGPERRGPGGRGSEGPERRGPGGPGERRFFGLSNDFGPERRGPGGRGSEGPERRGPGGRGSFDNSENSRDQKKNRGLLQNDQEMGSYRSYGPGNKMGRFQASNSSVSSLSSSDSGIGMEARQFLANLLHGTTCASVNHKCLCCCGHYIPNVDTGKCEDLTKLVPGIEDVLDNMDEDNEAPTRPTEVSAAFQTRKQPSENSNKKVQKKSIVTDF